MHEKMKIAQLVLNLNLGGLERLVVNFLSSLDKNTLSISVGSLEEPGDLAGEVQAMGLPITTFGRREGIDLKLIPRIAKWLKRERADILHTHNSAAHFYGSIAGRLAGVKTVIHTKHGRDWPDQPRKVLLNRISSLFTTKIVAVSDNARNVAETVEKVPRKKVVTIHNGIDVDEFKPVSEKTGGGFFPNIPHGSIIIGTVARLSREKDQKTMIEAFNEIRRKRAGIYLVLAGDGPLKQELETTARKLPCGRDIIFTGALKNIPSLLAELDIFLLTSSTEGISLALLEAAASEVPAVVTNVGGNREVVVDGSTGLIVSPGSSVETAAAVEQLLDDPHFRRSAGIRARERVIEHFSLKGMTGKYERLYRECAAG